MGHQMHRVSIQIEQLHKAPLQRKWRNPISWISNDNDRPMRILRYPTYMLKRIIGRSKTCRIPSRTLFNTGFGTQDLRTLQKSKGTGCQNSTGNVFSPECQNRCCSRCAPLCPISTNLLMPYRFWMASSAALSARNSAACRRRK